MELLHCQLPSSNVHCTVLSPSSHTLSTCQEEMECVIEFLSFFFPPPVCFPLTVQNVTHKDFFLSFPNVLNLGNFSPFAGSRRFSWQLVVP